MNVWVLDDSQQTPEYNFMSNYLYIKRLKLFTLMHCTFAILYRVVGKVVKAPRLEFVTKSYSVAQIFSLVTRSFNISPYVAAQASDVLS